MKIGELLRAIHGYHGQPSTEYALKLLPLVFVRPSELRCAEWVEFDLKNGLWRIPGPRMKMRGPGILHSILEIELDPLSAPQLTGDGAKTSGNNFSAYSVEGCPWWP